MNTAHIITIPLLKELGFKLDTYKDGYGKASSIRMAGKTVITWNEEGYSCDYFGNPLKPNVAIAIKEDGGTRTVFNGCIYNQTDLRKIVELIK